MRVQFEGGNKTRAGTILQRFRTRMRTALLANLARMNVKSALDCDNSTYYSCTGQLSDRRYRTHSN